MELKDLFRTAHHLIAVHEGRDISQSSMASRLGLSLRTYIEYLNGGRKPLAVKASLKMLGQLQDSEIIQLVRSYNKGLENEK